MFFEGIDIKKAFRYAKHGELSKLEKSVTKNPDIVASKDSSGVPLLIAAIEAGNLEIVTFVVKHGASIDTTDASGRCALSSAIVHKHDQIISMLLKMGANVNSRDTRSRSPMHFAALDGDENTIFELIAYSAEVNAADSEGFTPLHCALHAGHLHIALMLVDYDADFEVPDKRGESSLQFATRKHLDRFVVHAKELKQIPMEERKRPILKKKLPIIDLAVHDALSKSASVRALLQPADLRPDSGGSIVSELSRKRSPSGVSKLRSEERLNQDKQQQQQQQQEKPSSSNQTQRATDDAAVKEAESAQAAKIHAIQRKKPEVLTFRPYHHDSLDGIRCDRDALRQTMVTDQSSQNSIFGILSCIVDPNTWSLTKSEEAKPATDRQDVLSNSSVVSMVSSGSHSRTTQSSSTAHLARMKIDSNNNHSSVATMKSLSSLPDEKGAKISLSSNHSNSDGNLVKNRRNSRSETDRKSSLAETEASSHHRRSSSGLSTGDQKSCVSVNDANCEVSGDHHQVDGHRSGEGATEISNLSNDAGLFHWLAQPFLSKSSSSEM